MIQNSDFKSSDGKFPVEDIFIYGGADTLSGVPLRRQFFALEEQTMKVCGKCGKEIGGGDAEILCQACDEAEAQGRRI
ncbi:MAG: hypothetical protein AABZ55_01770, partial [Bdellovibrionota bacterium]